jgi:hypothetical protein
LFKRSGSPFLSCGLHDFPPFHPVSPSISSGAAVDELAVDVDEDDRLSVGRALHPDR